MNWRFWRLDWFGRKRIAELEDRLKRLEDEVMPARPSVYMSLMHSILWGAERSKGLTLREQVDRIQEHLKISFETVPERVVLKVAKKK
jgi:hypothetical protein